jgi:hypothetical protein
MPILLTLLVVNTNMNSNTINRVEAFTPTFQTNLQHTKASTSRTSSAASSSPFLTKGSNDQQHSNLSNPSNPPSNTSPRQNTFLMYQPDSNNNEPNKEAKDALKSGFWNALSYTEQWISDTLKNSTKSGSNPYARKELAYVCEMNTQSLASVAGIFRRFREAREMGERHALAEEEMARRDPRYEISTLRQTQVIIVPFCEYFDAFQTFEGVIQAINLARSNARDLVTDVSIEKMETMEKEWNVSINGASLHPLYGEQTPKEMIEELEEMEREGEMDMNKINLMRRRNQARRSPYPTLIVEVQASPPQFINEESYRRLGGSPPDSSSPSDDDDDLSRQGVLENVVLKLESIFAKSAALHKRTEVKEEDSEDSFYNAIGRASGIEEILASNPVSTTQQWIIDNDPLYNPNISSFMSADVQHADAAFEFVFSNFAMNKYSPSSGGKRKNYDIGGRSYLIMPKFVSASATSLEMFMSDVKNIIDAIDGLNERLSLSLMHPEHIRDERRSPAPVLAIQWYTEKDN